MMTTPLLKNDTIELNSKQVRNAAIEVVMSQFDMQINGYKYTQNEIWDSFLYASASNKTIRYTCMNLENAPSYNLLYTYLKNKVLKDLSLEEIEKRCNDMIVSTLPPRLDGHQQKVAIDLVLIPFYGDEETEDIRRSQAKKSTTKFFCYATAYLIKKNKRVTLCFTFVRPSDTLFDVLKKVLQMVFNLGIQIKRLYLDREFARTDIITYLKEQSHVSVIPIPKKGNELKSLLKRKEKLKTSYTMNSPKYGSVEFPLWIACRYSKGKHGKHGVVMLPYAVIGDCKNEILEISNEYKHRFGIESSYRLMNQARARTSSTDSSFRLLLVGIAFTLVNLWVYLKWFALLTSRMRGTDFDENQFPLALFCDFLCEEIKNTYGFILSIKL
jgi:putative transposase